MSAVSTPVMSGRFALVLLVLGASNCSRPAPRPDTPLPVADPPLSFAVGGRAVDILALVSNASSSIEPEWYLPAYHAVFETLLEDHDCASVNRDGCRVPDVRVGVITGDLGMGPYKYPYSRCVPSGDEGRLQTKARIEGCTPPADPWLRWEDGKTNVPGGADGSLTGFLEAFDCIARLPYGCGIQQHLEALRKALDPRLGINPGFLRDSALLVVALATDRDDCSAAKTELFNIEPSVIDQLGPNTLFRCVEFGLQCDEPFRPVGEKHNCRPGQDWLVKVDDYVQFLRTLRPGRALFLTVAGPRSPVIVGRDGTNPALLASCQKITNALPAIRLSAVAEALGHQGLFNPGGVDACATELAPAFRTLGKAILEHLESQCLPGPLVTAAGGLICSAGDDLAPGTNCAATCLDQADCTVEDVPKSGAPKPIPRCPANLTGKECSGFCPCWRVVRMPELCDPQKGGSLYALQVLRTTGLLAPSGTHARASCRTTTVAWGSEAMATALQCR